jgi:four helix bundle protein
MSPSNRESGRSGGSDRSRSERSSQHRRLRPSGGYRELRSFQTATVIYDATVSFCDRFLEKRSRTRDQMVQAARSGRQNIAEGSRAASTSSQTELRLVNVARASLDELLLDYEDFLRQRGKRQWKKDDPEARQVRAVGARRDPADRSDPTDHWKSYARWLEATDPAVVANAVLCLIHQTNYLLDQQIAALSEILFRRAATRSSSLLRGSKSGEGRRGLGLRICRIRRIGPISRMLRLLPRTAPPAARGWSCGLLARGNRAAHNFATARVIPSAEGRGSWRKRVAPKDPTDRSDPTDPSDQNSVSNGTPVFRAIPSRSSSTG